MHDTKINVLDSNYYIVYSNFVVYLSIKINRNIHICQQQFSEWYITDYLLYFLYVLNILKCACCPFIKKNTFSLLKTSRLKKKKNIKDRNGDVLKIKKVKGNSKHVQKYIDLVKKHYLLLLIYSPGCQFANVRHIQRPLKGLFCDYCYLNV